MKKRVARPRTGMPAAQRSPRRARQAPVDALTSDLQDHLGGLERSARRLHARASQLGDLRVEQTAANIRQAAVDMTALVTDFLDRTTRHRRGSGTPAPLDLGVIVTEVVRRYRPAAQAKQIRLILRPRMKPVLVAGQRAATSQILANLLSNAVKFSPRGKRVWITVTAPPRGGGRCEVRDEGPGISGADRRHLFGRYRRLTARPTAGESSTGLGLSIARKLAASMNGTLRCGRGPGARFILTLPAAPVRGL